MLALFDSTITFHARYQQRRDVATLVDLLVLDGDNPRSLAWVTQTLRGRIARLAGSAPGKLTALSHELPDPAGWTLEQIAGCDVLLVDGTLWSEDELQRLHPGTPSASDMGHMPVGGATGSLEQLKPLSHVRRIYTHINNSNPILTEGSPEQKAVLDAGFEIAFDGMEIVL